MPGTRTVGESRGGWFTAAVALGAALITIGALVGYETWSNRSNPPVDDLLPMVAADLAADHAGEERGEQEPSSPADAPAGSAPEATTPVADDEGDASPDPPESVEAEIVVHVSGEVRSSGVVVLDVGARVVDAVEAAGGAKPTADLDRVNLAAPVVDGERIHVPAIGEDEAPAMVPTIRPTAPSATTAEQSDPIVNINTASVDELQSLPGVGPATAEAIARTRDERGPFLSVDELLEVPGIGDAKLETMRPFAAIG